ncbi:MAG TPA: DUF1902 domain-containing protein [Gammaproteobacteria bacterium]|nr:DUF1902 domain-containing protein [Gammaproteobacteria bacterium]
MRARDLKLRCYAEQNHDGSWFGICIDLNLAADGDSLEEVRRKLDDQVRDYIEEALGDDVAYIDDLIPRPAPLPFRIRYHYIRFLCWLDRMRKGGGGCDGHSLLSLGMPLKPA